jgi:hypothetical protein
MQPMYYIGLDVHKRTISYCVKDASGAIQGEGTLPATRAELDRWMNTLPQPWTAAMKATVFTGWIYDHLKPHAAALKVAHPLMLRAIAASKKKNDRIDAKKTNSIFWSAGKAEPANGSLVLLRRRNHRARAPDERRRNRKNLHPRSSQARRESSCPLHKDLSWKSRYRNIGTQFPIRALLRR